VVEVRWSSWYGVSRPDLQLSQYHEVSASIQSKSRQLYRRAFIPGYKEFLPWIVPISHFSSQLSAAELACRARSSTVFDFQLLTSRPTNAFFLHQSIKNMLASSLVALAIAALAAARPMQYQLPRHLQHLVVQKRAPVPAPKPVAAPMPVAVAHKRQAGESIMLKSRQSC
jgi:hypothetical protein